MGKERSQSKTARVFLSVAVAVGVTASNPESFSANQQIPRAREAVLPSDEELQIETSKEQRPSKKLIPTPVFVGNTITPSQP